MVGTPEGGPPRFPPPCTSVSCNLLTDFERTDHGRSQKTSFPLLGYEKTVAPVSGVDSLRLSLSLVHSVGTQVYFVSYGEVHVAREEPGPPYATPQGRLEIFAKSSLQLRPKPCLDNQTSGSQETLKLRRRQGLSHPQLPDLAKS